MLTYQLSKITSTSFYYMDIKTSVTEDQNVKKKYYFLFEGFPFVESKVFGFCNRDRRWNRPD